MAWADKKDSRFHASVLQVPNDRVLDASFWGQFGGGAHPPMREKIIFVSIDDLGRVGPATFNVKLVCDELGVSYSLINHHFGNRDELIAEASIRWYMAYVEGLWAAAQAASSDPESRLRAWLLASVAWAKKYSGVAAILNYPTASLDVTHLLTTKWSKEIASWGELNLGRLLCLIRDVRFGQVRNYDHVQLGAVPHAELTDDPTALALNASIGWSILGLAVWSAGKHIPTGELLEANLEADAAISFHLDNIIHLVKQGV